MDVGFTKDDVPAPDGDVISATSATSYQTVMSWGGYGGSHIGFHNHRRGRYDNQSNHYSYRESHIGIHTADVGDMILNEEVVWAFTTADVGDTIT